MYSQVFLLVRFLSQERLLVSGFLYEAEVSHTYKTTGKLHLITYLLRGLSTQANDTDRLTAARGS
jgi:hypothetical protein